MTGRRMESNLEKSTISEHDVNLGYHDRSWPPVAEKALLTSCSALRYLSNGDVEIAVGGEQKQYCDLQWKFVVADEAVSSTNRLKAFILKAFHGLLNSFSLKRAVIKAKESISKALDQLVKSDEALSFFEAFHTLLAFLVSLLAALIGLHFQVLGISPLDTHFAVILLFIMATIVYSIAYAEIKLQPPDAGLPIFRGNKTRQKSENWNTTSDPTTAAIRKYDLVPTDKTVAKAQAQTCIHGHGATCQIDCVSQDLGMDP
ncbi:hypothetical protein SO802_020520 [Lithocarpus litseifolius]|uniref:Uncharacterized protein n=1 Tax=Lithocarpus litseifolius TaxID=425828 RepID=A0AAW2CF09_9ROSI